VNGFTVQELVIVLMVIAITLAIAAQAYGFFLSRTAARRAAEIFVLDLALTRTAAMRERRPVTLKAQESLRRYSIRSSMGDTLAYRNYDGDGEMELTQLQIDLPGDSLRFNGRGIANLGGGPGTLGTARFTAGAMIYTVRFNSTGTAEIQAP
jgi:prepilin-type N-terminal cleavage/methylation domain-containing protein